MKKIEVKRVSCWWEVYISGPNNSDRKVVLSFPELENLHFEIGALIMDKYVEDETTKKAKEAKDYGKHIHSE